MAAIVFPVEGGIPDDALDYTASPWTAPNGTQWTYKEVGTTGRWTPYSAAGGGTWGTITGTLSAQTDLQTALNAKSALAGSTSITTLGTITTGTWQGTSIADSYISSAATWNAKQAALVSGTNIKTVGSQSLLGSGDLTVANIGAESTLGNPSVSGAALVSTTGGVRSWTGGALSVNATGPITTAAGGYITTGGASGYISTSSSGYIVTNGNGAIQTSSGGYITTGTNGYIETDGFINTLAGGSITTGATAVNFATGVTIAQGGTGATTASTACTSLGVGSTDAVTFARLTITAGTVTSSTPLFSATQTWNNTSNTFTGAVINITDTASSSSSIIQDWQVGGSSRMSIRKDGLITASSGFITTGSGGYVVSRDVGTSRIDGVVLQASSTASAGATVKNSPSVVWLSRGWNTTATASSKNNSVECLLIPTTGATTSGILTFRNITVDGTANTTELFTCTTGGAFAVNGTVKTAGYTVATLPASPTTGMRCYVTDATATTFYSTATGGGANVVPVFYNGTNWVIA